LVEENKHFCWYKSNQVKDVFAAVLCRAWLRVTLGLTARADTQPGAGTPCGKTVAGTAGQPRAAVVRPTDHHSCAPAVPGWMQFY